MQKNKYSVKRSPYMFTLRIIVYFSGRTKILTAHPPKIAVLFTRNQKKTAQKVIFLCYLTVSSSPPPPFSAVLYLDVFGFRSTM